MAGTVPAFHLVCDADAILLNPYGMTDLDGRFLGEARQMDGIGRTHLRTLGAFGGGSNRVRRTFPAASVLSSPKKDGALGWDIPICRAGRLCSVVASGGRSVSRRSDGSGALGDFCPR